MSDILHSSSNKHAARWWELLGAVAAIATIVTFIVWAHDRMGSGAKPTTNSNASQQTETPKKESLTDPKVIRLSQLVPVPGSGDASSEEAQILGVSYPASVGITCGENTVKTIEYNLGGKYSTLSGYIGPGDNTAVTRNPVTVQLDIEDTDSNVLLKTTSQIGHPFRVEKLNVKGIVRLRFICNATDNDPNYGIYSFYTYLADMKLEK